MWSDIENKVRTILNAIDLLEPTAARIILNRNAGRPDGEDLRLYSVGRSNSIIENIDSRFYGIMKSQRVLQIPSISQSRLLSELAVGDGAAVFYPLNSRFGYCGFIWACFPAEGYGEKIYSTFVGCCEWMEMLMQRWLDDELGVPVQARHYLDIMERMQIPAMILLLPDRMMLSNTAFEDMKEKDAFIQAFLNEEKHVTEGKSLSEFDYVQQKIDFSEEKTGLMYIFPHAGNEILEMRFGENEIQYYHLLTEKALGSLSLLESSGELSNMQKNYIDKTSSPLRRMEALFEFGSKHYQRSENSILSFAVLSIQEIAQTVIFDLAAAARKKRVEIELSTENEGKGHPSGKAVGDPWLLTLAVFDLLDNAIRFSQMDGKAISVKILYGDTEWKLRVEDFGTGIAPLDLERIREQSYAEAAGSGLHGIALVKYVAKVHNGKLQIESRLGKGSVFTLTIPNSNF